VRHFSGPSLLEDEDIQPIREAVKQLCSDFPGEYWREKDAASAYPSEFVQAMTDSGCVALQTSTHFMPAVPRQVLVACLETDDLPGSNRIVLSLPFCLFPAPCEDFYPFSFLSNTGAAASL
jgi:hypothetical protein